jgi:hypothetical protein
MIRMDTHLTLVGAPAPDNAECRWLEPDWVP